MAEIVNGRCHAERAPQNSPPLIQNGKLVLQAHHIGWMVSSAFTGVAIVVSFWLIYKHTRSYHNKYEQRYIVRILFMVPLYAIISLASYFWWNHSTPLLLIRDCYESTVLTAFFYLLLLYISPDVNVQKEIFRKNGLSKEHDRWLRKRGEPPQKWMLPLGLVKWRPADGLHFLQLMKWGVLQYCVIRPTTTLAAVILDYAGLYCEDSWSPGWGHIYITIVVSISVSIAMYCLIQLYMAVKVELAPQKPLLKLFAIKAVVFLTFWQATFLSVLTLLGVVKDTPYMTADNINIGIGAILETFEMACFAILHIRAFSYKPYYDPDAPTPGWRSLVHAMSFKETGREIWTGIVYMTRRSRGLETDPQARREAALETVFGRSRIAINREANMVTSNCPTRASDKDSSVTVAVKKEVHLNNERQWLGVGDNYVYGLGYQAKPRREKSEGLEEQIDRELARRGYGLQDKYASSAQYSPVVDVEAAAVPGYELRQSSWWRRVYIRLSQTGPDANEEQYSRADPSDSLPHVSRHISTDSRPQGKRTRPGAAPLMHELREEDYDDPPPPSAIRTYRESKKRNGAGRKAPHAMPPSLLSASFADIPSPLSSPDASCIPPPALPYRLDMDDPLLVTTQQLAASSSSSPLPTPGTESVQADSFLDRAFTASVEPSSSVDVLSTGPSSSQSHHNLVKLGPHPDVAMKISALPQLPTVNEPPVIAGPSSSRHARSPVGTNSRNPHTPPMSIAVQPNSASTRSTEPTVPAMWAHGEPRTRASHRRYSVQHVSDMRYEPPLPSFRPQPERSPPRLQRAALAYSRGAPRRNSAAPQYTPPPNRFVPTRGQIVLPAPLAPSTTQGAQVFASPRYSPPGLPTSPSIPPQSRRRSTAPSHPNGGMISGPTR
ncbi:DUF300-domain-containing protein [Trametes gibbosa]|nr:DUF300-domain-containing protein [Trametes gibbosa]